jgi:hypothetical protein
VSGEVESRIQCNSNDVTADEEKLTLENVKRIGKKMMALKDFFIAKDRLLIRCNSLSSSAKTMIFSEATSCDRIGGHVINHDVKLL